MNSTWIDHLKPEEAERLAAISAARKESSRERKRIIDRACIRMRRLKAKEQQS